MVEAKWMGILAVFLAWGGTVWSQAPSVNAVPASAGAPAAQPGVKGKVITVQEFGKQAQQCRIQKSWVERDGATVFEVEALDTKERMTIVENVAIAAPNSTVKAMTSRIYHWMHNSPPPGTPLPPPDLSAPAPLAAAPTQKPADAATQVEAAAPPLQVAPVAHAPGSPSPVADAAGAADARQFSWGKANDHKPAVLDLPHADSSRPDPLREPESYSARSLDEGVKEMGEHSEVRAGLAAEAAAAAKAGSSPPAPEVTETVTPKPALAAAEPVQAAPQAANMVTPAPAPTVALPRAAVKKTADAGFMSGIKRLFGKGSAGEEKVQTVAEIEGKNRDNPGAGSVVAASKKTPGQPYYVPVPIMTMPPVRTRQGVVTVPRPMYRTPSPSQLPPSDVENAFTKAPPPPPTPVKTEPEVVNAFTTVVAEPPPESLNGFATPPRTPPPAPQGMMVPQGVPPQAMTAPQGMPSQAMMLPQSAAPQAIMVPQAPQAMMLPQSAAPQAIMVPQAPQAIMVQRGMAPQRMMIQGMPPQAMMVQTMPPQAMMVQNGPQGMVPAPQGMVARLPMAQPTMMTEHGRSTPAVVLRQPTNLPTVDVAQMLVVLRNSLYPSHREWAAENLSTINWNANPYVVEGLMQAAREDPAASVRAACIRSLGSMNVNTMTVVETLQALRADQDPQVQREAQETLVKLGAAPAATIQQVSGQH